MSFQSSNQYTVKPFYKTTIVNEYDIISYCHRSIESFYDEGDITVTKDGVYIYQQESENKVLAVAHLDTVLDYKTYGRGLTQLYVPQLDDRLGVYSLLEILRKKYNHKFDLLLTEGEESGNSTAKHFQTDKEYNWIFEIDRSGTDVVMYQFETLEARKLLQEFGFKVGIGTFTDITYMDSLKVLGFNFGCAYYNNHSSNSYVDLEEYEIMLMMIDEFFRQYKDTKMPFDPKDSIEYQYYHDPYDYSYSEYAPSGTSTAIALPINKALFSTCKICSMINFLEDIKCYNCGEVLEDEVDIKCTTCNLTNCTGTERCNGCSQFFHNSDFVVAFDHCSDCLQAMFGIDVDDIYGYEEACIIDDTANKNKYYWKINSRMAF